MLSPAPGVADALITRSSRLRTDLYGSGLAARWARARWHLWTGSASVFRTLCEAGAITRHLLREAIMPAMLRRATLFAGCAVSFAAAAGRSLAQTVTTAAPISYRGRPDLPLLRAAVALRGVGKRTLHRCADDGTSSRQAPRGLCRQSQCGREGSFPGCGHAITSHAGKARRTPGGDPHDRAQQWRRPCKPLDVLAGYGRQGR